MSTTSAQLSLTTVNVAVAVIHYQEQYLLGFRNQSQHQGNRYEFVGGKIDANETAKEALIREVSEEVGIDISANLAIKMGRLHHDYGDKKVCLQVYKVTLTAVQFATHQHCLQGLEGQALSWVSKRQLLAGEYVLPAANQTILSWLQLPAQLVITYPLAHFDDPLTATEITEATEAWLTYHQHHLPQSAWVYMRIKAQATEPLINTINEQRQSVEGRLSEQLLTLRPDIQSIIAHSNMTERLGTQPQIKASHLTHMELMQWFTYSINERNGYNQEPHLSLCVDQPLIISCHDIASIHAANQLAATRLNKQQAPVIGIFLSPVLTTQSHPDDEPLGWEAWSALAQLADMPVIALGGLSPSTYEQATFYGATSIAGIRQFMSR